VRTISRKDLSGNKLGFFLAGFVEGEGSFNVSLRKKTDYKVSWQVVMSFNVSQKDPTILKILKDQLNCGIIKVRKRDNLHSYNVTNPQDIIQKVIPYFREFPVLSDSKKKNFAIFCKIASLMETGEHKNLSGLRKILELRENLNLGKGRTRKYSIKDIFPE
jgi:LAGLIDADG endonuclease